MINKEGTILVKYSCQKKKKWNNRYNAMLGGNNEKIRYDTIFV